MASSYTPRLILPEMADGEGSGYITFNEMARILDAFVQLQVESETIADPPGSPSDGQLWRVATGGTGAWAGQDGKLAQWYNGTWYFYDATNFVAWIKDREYLAVFQEPVIYAFMALAGAPVAHSFTTAPTAYAIADDAINDPQAPAPSVIDLANSRITVNDYLQDFPVLINAHASIDGSGNNVVYALQIYKNGAPVDHLRDAFTCTNQSPNAALVIPGGIEFAKAGDVFEARFSVSSGTQSIDVRAFSFSIVPIR